MKGKQVMQKAPKAVHLGYLHRYDDGRILRKECASLARHGYDVTFITSDRNASTEETEIDGVKIRVLDGGRKRLIRYIGYLSRVKKAALREDADIYHVHEAVLIPTALKLKKKGYRVVYDMHEDSPRQMLSSLSSMFGAKVGGFLSRRIESMENKLVRQADAAITVVPVLLERLKKAGARRALILYNYPILERFEKPAYSKTKRLLYVGGISEARGITNLVDAMETIDGVLTIGGNFPDAYKKSLSEKPGWEKVETPGFLNKDEVYALCCDSAAGMCTLKNTPNHYISLPIKMFEYMNAGLPVIASDFPAIREVIDKEQSGIIVDPDDVDAIREAVRYILEHPEEAEAMGSRGFEGVMREYNWGEEEKKLLALYEELLQERA